MQTKVIIYCATYQKPIQVDQNLTPVLVSLTLSLPGSMNMAGLLSLFEDENAKYNYP